MKVAAEPLVSCDTFVVMGDVSATGEVVFGKNSDRPNGEVQELVYHPRQKYGEGENKLKENKILSGSQGWPENVAFGGVLYG